LSGFGGWVFGLSIFGILLNQGRNIMLNMFFGPAVNAAQGLANAVNTALLSFGNNFKQAIVPQLVKSYVAEDPNLKWSLAERGTRITYFLFFILSVPLLLETEFILKLWLENVPEYTAVFVRFMVVDALTMTLLWTFHSIIDASGKMKAMYGFAYISAILILVLSYLFLRAGYPPQYIFVATLLVRILLGWPFNFILLKKLFNLPIRFFIRKAIIPIFLVSTVSFLPFFFANNLFSESMLRSGIIIITSMLWTSVVVMLVGLRKNERIKIIAFVKRKILLR